MTFDEWWAKKWADMGSAVGHAEKDIAKQAWEAATEAEREACAQVCEAQVRESGTIHGSARAMDCAVAIRARKP